MAANTVPPRASFLGLAGELRQKILKHVFAGSQVNLGGFEVASMLQPNILATCRQLLLEGQDLLTSATTLWIGDDVYHKWTDCVPDSVATLYLPNIQYVNLKVDQYFLFAFDDKLLPSLKILPLRGYGDSLIPFPPNPCARTILNKSDWDKMLD